VRELAGTGLERIGIPTDQARTMSAGGPLAGMGTPDAPARVLVVRTNEKLRAARRPRATVHPAAVG
jgi:hypothetical protein